MTFMRTKVKVVITKIVATIAQKRFIMYRAKASTPL